MKVAVIFSRWGPYHVARLSGAANVMDIVGIELARDTNIYDWSYVEHPTHLSRVTLFPDVAVESLSWRELFASLEATLNRLRPNVVFVNGWSNRAAFISQNWASRSSVATVVMSESNFHDFPRSSLTEFVKRRIVRLHSAGLVSGTHSAEYLAKLGIPREHIFCGYGAVDNTHFSRTGTSLTSSQVRLKQPYVLSVGRFIEKKNFSFLLQAFAKLRQFDTSRELILLGDGPLKQRLVREATELGLSDCVQFPGFAQYDELPGYFHGADYFVLPSLTEQWGLVVNEAMAASLPVLVSNRCGSARDLVHDGQNGYRFDPNNVEELVRLMSLMNRASPAEMRKMAQTSQMIIQSWGPEKFAAGMYAAAERAVAIGPRSATWLDRQLLKQLARR